jgi:uncharacterized membrane protein
LLAGLAYAAYYLFGKRYFARYDASTLFAYALPLGAVLLLPAVRFAPKSAQEWLVLLFLAVVPTYGAYSLYSIGLARVEATRAATVATIEPVAAAALAYIVWGEALHALGYVGAALVIAGVLVVATERQTRVARRAAARRAGAGRTSRVRHRGFRHRGVRHRWCLTPRESRRKPPGRAMLVARIRDVVHPPRGDSWASCQLEPEIRSRSWTSRASSAR